MYGAVSPDGPEHFEVMFAKSGELWRGDWSLTADQLATIGAPALVLLADDDVLTVEHAAAMARELRRRSARGGTGDFARAPVREARPGQPADARLPRRGAGAADDVVAGPARRAGVSRLPVVDCRCGGRDAAAYGSRS